MSYMKNHAENEALKHAFEDMQAAQRRHQRDELERLAWEAQRAMQDYLAALTEYEQHRNEDAGRRADAAIEAGENPF